MVDPHAENYYNWSPYAYVGNNLLRYIDPTGMDTIHVAYNSGGIDPMRGNLNDPTYTIQAVGTGGENIIVVDNDLNPVVVTPKGQWVRGEWNGSYYTYNISTGESFKIPGEKGLEIVSIEFDALYCDCHWEKSCLVCCRKIYR